MLCVARNRPQAGISETRADDVCSKETSVTIGARAATPSRRED